MADPWLMEVPSRKISSQVKNKLFTQFSVVSPVKVSKNRALLPNSEPPL
jgi:hypothetical protein